MSLRTSVRFLIALATGVAGERIINGTVVKGPSHKYPFFALPTTASNNNRWLGCGASIVSPTFGLSSAHCFGGGTAPCSGPQDVALWLGDVEMDADGLVTPIKGGRHARVTAQVQCSASFDGKCSHGNDLALLKLQEPLPSWVRPAPLNLVGLNVGDAVTTLGFGMTESERDSTVIGNTATRLREVTVNVLAQDAVNCGRVYAGGYGCSDDASEAPATNLNMQFCAGETDGHPRDACGGDSGSPVVDINGAQVGLVSYGGGPGAKVSGPGRECGDPNFPGVYARVSAFSAFLKENVPDLVNSGPAEIQASPASMSFALRGSEQTY